MEFVNKKRYMTTLETLEQFRAENTRLATEKLSYNGILDPMASGVLPILVGETENTERDKYTGSQKMYDVRVLVGIRTDSSDLLGKVIEFSDDNFNRDIIENAFANQERSFEQTVPMHSNRKVRGKRLWWWILNGTEIPEEERPKNSVHLYSINNFTQSYLSLSELKSELDRMSEIFVERFRMKEIYPTWFNVFEKLNSDHSFLQVAFSVHVSSGFYVRTFVDTISRKIGIPMCIYSLHRSNVFYSQDKEYV